MAQREFDLNIERVLENWTVAHAIRELIADALDEAALTGTAEPRIEKVADGSWHIRDFGRGLRYENLTQNENTEKLANPEKVVGKLGVGLKDALATFDRRGIGVRIRSRFGDISTAKQHKHGFEDITTLHAVIDDPTDPGMTGTDVELRGADDADVEAAKALFRHYAGARCSRRPPTASCSSGRVGRLASTSTAFVSRKSAIASSATTSPRRPGAARRAQSRALERGRSAYTDRVKSIVLAATSEQVALD